MKSPIDVLDGGWRSRVGALLGLWSDRLRRTAAGLKRLPRPDLLTGYLMGSTVFMALLAAATLFIYRDGFLLSHSRSLVVVSGTTVPFESCVYLGTAGIVRRLPLQSAVTGKTKC